MRPHRQVLKKKKKTQKTRPKTLETDSTPETGCSRPGKKESRPPPRHEDFDPWPFGLKVWPFQVRLGSSGMAHRLLSMLLQAWEEHLFGTDPGFTYEMADVVRTSHIDREVVQQDHPNPTLMCILACQKLASCPCAQHQRLAQNSWDSLTLLQRSDLKKAVRLPSGRLRTWTLLALAGVHPIPGGDRVSFHVRECGASSGPARGARAIKRMSCHYDPHSCKAGHAPLKRCTLIDAGT